MNTMVNYEMYRDQECVPAWIRAERYEYCEQNSRSAHFNVKNIFNKFFNR